MPTMAPGITFYAKLQPFLIGLGDLLMVLVLVMAVVVTVATFVYIFRRELGWWREEEQPVPVAKADAPADDPHWSDRVIKDVAQQYLHYDRLVLTNIGGARSVAIGRTYPDIVIKERVPPAESRREPRLLLVGEVETTDTFTAEHAARWRTISRLGAPFALFVPQESVDEAGRLVAQESLSAAQLWGYTYVHGRIQLTLAKESIAPGAGPSIPLPGAAQAAAAPV